MTSTTDPWANYADKRESELSIADKQAIADPTKYGSEEIRLARYLAAWLDYDYASYHHRLKKKARELLEHSKGDYQGMWDVVQAKAEDGKLKDWVIAKDANIFAVTNILKDAYSRHLEREHKREQSNTTEGRRNKYAGGKYADLILS